MADSWAIQMRTELIKALYFPMSMIYSSIDLEACPQAGIFVSSDTECQECGFASECEWLNNSDQFTAVAQKTDDELRASLEFARNYVSAFTALAKHNARACMCEACTWLRDTRKFVSEGLM